jgi:hypothetical protein
MYLCYDVFFSLVCTLFGGFEARSKQTGIYGSASLDLGSLWSLVCSLVTFLLFSYWIHIFHGSHDRIHRESNVSSLALQMSSVQSSNTLQFCVQAIWATPLWRPDLSLSRTSIHMISDAVSPSTLHASLQQRRLAVPFHSILSPLSIRAIIASTGLEPPFFSASSHIQIP